ncbi:hypothetical protein CPC08DRAFT_104563 [Agrocybe pediades]|nr:hypothetical protein CPC08DRAFT_104563 [Agrocybe pediades]
MHAFLSKVFGRKKEDKEPSPTSLRPGELLDGKFEAVSPNVSPIGTNIVELDAKANGQEAQDKDKEGGFSLFRAKSRPSSPDIKPKKLTDTLPQLSLNFAGPSESSNANTIDSLLELDLDSQILLSEAVIGQRRLNPLEALVLIRACSQAIISTGLETLGVMHPHWYSSSPEVQRRLISQFIHSLNPAPSALITPLSPNSTLITPFEAEVNSRSPHDVAAVLRWALRHLQLEGEHFGTDDGWYKAFLDAEAAANYPPKAFSEKLAPKLPSAHLDLLVATLEIFSSLASHSEANGTSGNKLSKIFGLWLLTARRVEDKDDWYSFYQRWERTGRMLEHLFLARIRDESADHRMPVRLLELVRKYPYTQGLSSPTTDLQLLPPSRFATQHHDALFVRIEVELPSGKRKPKSKIHPLNLLADAFSTTVEGEYAELWTKISAASKDGTSPSPLSNIFADETIRFLSIIPDKGKAQEAKSPAFSIASPSSPRRQSLTIASSDKENGKPEAQTQTRHTKPATDPFPLTPVSASDIGSDWAQFSSSGFLDSTPAIAPLVSTLFDTDVEKTVPPDSTPLSRKSSKRARPSAATSRKSVDFAADPVPPPPVKERTISEEEREQAKTIVKASKIDIIQIDEAFIDFWSDSLLDPITLNWPTFIICKFKSTLVPQLVFGPVIQDQKQKTLKWLVLEQAFTVGAPTPPPASTPPRVDNMEVASPSSPTPSTSSRKIFSFFSRTTSSSSVGSQSQSQKGKKKEKATGGAKVGEMGELIEEEVVPAPPRMSFSRSKKSVDRKPVPAEDAAAPVGVLPTTEEKEREKDEEEEKKKPTQEEAGEKKVLDGSGPAAGIVGAAVGIGAVAVGAAALASSATEEEEEKEKGEEAQAHAQAQEQKSLEEAHIAKEVEEPAVQAEDSAEVAPKVEEVGAAVGGSDQPVEPSQEDVVSEPTKAAVPAAQVEESIEAAEVSQPVVGDAVQLETRAEELPAAVDAQREEAAKDVLPSQAAREVEDDDVVASSDKEEVEQKEEPDVEVKEDEVKSQPIVDVAQTEIQVEEPSTVDEQPEEVVGEAPYVEHTVVEQSKTDEEVSPPVVESAVQPETEVDEHPPAVDEQAEEVVIPTQAAPEDDGTLVVASAEKEEEEEEARPVVEAQEAVAAPTQESEDQEREAVVERAQEAAVDSAATGVETDEVPAPTHAGVPEEEEAKDVVEGPVDSTSNEIAVQDAHTGVAEEEQLIPEVVAAEEQGAEVMDAPAETTPETVEAVVQEPVQELDEKPEEIESIPVEVQSVEPESSAPVAAEPAEDSKEAELTSQEETVAADTQAEDVSEAGPVEVAEVPSESATEDTQDAVDVVVAESKEGGEENSTTEDIVADSHSVDDAPAETAVAVVDAPAVKEEPEALPAVEQDPISSTAANDIAIPTADVETSHEEIAESAPSAIDDEVAEHSEPVIHESEVAAPDVLPAEDVKVDEESVPAAAAEDVHSEAKEKTSVHPAEEPSALEPSVEQSEATPVEDVVPRESPDVPEVEVKPKEEEAAVGKSGANAEELSGPVVDESNGKIDEESTPAAVAPADVELEGTVPPSELVHEDSTLQVEEPATESDKPTQEAEEEIPSSVMPVHSASPSDVEDPGLPSKSLPEEQAKGLLDESQLSGEDHELDNVENAKETTNDGETPVPEAEALAEDVQSSVVVASAVPSIEPITTHEDPSDALVDLPPVPLTEPILPVNEEAVHMTVPLKESEPLVEDEANISQETAPQFDSTVVEPHAASESVIAAGSTPGPQVILDVADVKADADKAGISEERATDDFTASEAESLPVSSETVKEETADNAQQDAVAEATPITIPTSPEVDATPLETQEVANSEHVEDSAQETEVTTDNVFEQAPVVIDEEPRAPEETDTGLAVEAEAEHAAEGFADNEEPASTVQAEEAEQSLPDEEGAIVESTGTTTPAVGSQYLGQEPLRADDAESEVVHAGAPSEDVFPSEERLQDTASVAEESPLISTQDEVVKPVVEEAENLDVGARSIPDDEEDGAAASENSVAEEQVGLEADEKASSVANASSGTTSSILQVEDVADDNLLSEDIPAPEDAVQESEPVKQADVDVEPAEVSTPIPEPESIATEVVQTQEHPEAAKVEIDSSTMPDGDETSDPAEVKSSEEPAAVLSTEENPPFDTLPRDTDAVPAADEVADVKESISEAEHETLPSDAQTSKSEIPGVAVKLPRWVEIEAPVLTLMMEEDLPNISNEAETGSSTKEEEDAAHVQADVTPTEPATEAIPAVEEPTLVEPSAETQSAPHTETEAGIADATPPPAPPTEVAPAEEETAPVEIPAEADPVHAEAGAEVAGAQPGVEAAAEAETVPTEPEATILESEAEMAPIDVKPVGEPSVDAEFAEPEAEVVAVTTEAEAVPVEEEHSAAESRTEEEAAPAAIGSEVDPSAEAESSVVIQELETEAQGLPIVVQDVPVETREEAEPAEISLPPVKDESVIVKAEGIASEAQTPSAKASIGNDAALVDIQAAGIRESSSEIEAEAVPSEGHASVGAGSITTPVEQSTEVKAAETVEAVSVEEPSLHEDDPTSSKLPLNQVEPPTSNSDLPADSVESEHAPDVDSKPVEADVAPVERDMLSTQDKPANEEVNAAPAHKESIVEPVLEGDAAPIEDETPVAEDEIASAVQSEVEGSHPASETPVATEPQPEVEPTASVTGLAPGGAPEEISNVTETKTAAVGEPSLETEHTHTEAEALSIGTEPAVAEENVKETESNVKPLAEPEASPSEVEPENSDLIEPEASPSDVEPPAVVEQAIIEKESEVVDPSAETEVRPAGVEHVVTDGVEVQASLSEESAAAVSPSDEDESRFIPTEVDLAPIEPAQVEATVEGITEVAEQPEEPADPVEAGETTIEPAAEAEAAASSVPIELEAAQPVADHEPQIAGPEPPVAEARAETGTLELTSEATEALAETASAVDSESEVAQPPAEAGPALESGPLLTEPPAETETGHHESEPVPTDKAEPAHAELDAMGAEEADQNVQHADTDVAETQPTAAEDIAVDSDTVPEAPQPSNSDSIAEETANEAPSAPSDLTPLAAPEVIALANNSDRNSVPNPEDDEVALASTDDAAQKAEDGESESAAEATSDEQVSPTSLGVAEPISAERISEETPSEEQVLASVQAAVANVAGVPPSEIEESELIPEAIHPPNEESAPPSEDKAVSVSSEVVPSVEETSTTKDVDVSTDQDAAAAAEEATFVEEGSIDEAEPVDVTAAALAQTIPTHEESEDGKVELEPPVETADLVTPVNHTETNHATDADKLDVAEDPILEVDSKVEQVESDVLNGNGHHYEVPNDKNMVVGPEQSVVDPLENGDVAEEVPDRVVSDYATSEPKHILADAPETSKVDEGDVSHVAKEDTHEVPTEEVSANV